MEAQLRKREVMPCSSCIYHTAQDIFARNNILEAICPHCANMMIYLLKLPSVFRDHFQVYCLASCWQQCRLQKTTRPHITASSGYATSEEDWQSPPVKTSISQLPAHEVVQVGLWS